MVDANFWRGRCFWGQFFRKHSTQHYEASTRNTWRNALNKLKWFPIEICTNHYQWSSLSESIASTLSSLSQNYEIRLQTFLAFLAFLDDSCLAWQPKRPTHGHVLLDICPIPQPWQSRSRKAFLSFDSWSWTGTLMSTFLLHIPVRKTWISSRVPT